MKKPVIIIERDNQQIELTDAEIQMICRKAHDYNNLMCAKSHLIEFCNAHDIFVDIPELLSPSDIENGKLDNIIELIAAEAEKQPKDQVTKRTPWELIIRTAISPYISRRIAKKIMQTWPVAIKTDDSWFALCDIVRNLILRNKIERYSLDWNLCNIYIQQRKFVDGLNDYDRKRLINAFTQANCFDMINFYRRYIRNC